MTNLFEVATRKAYRFSTSIGELTVEHLWELPIETNNSRGVCLRTIATELNAKVKQDTDLDWLGAGGNTSEQEEIKNKLAIIKHIVETRRAEVKAAQDAETQRSLLDRLMKIKQSRIEGAYEKMSDEELDKMIADLNK